MPDKKETPFEAVVGAEGRNRPPPINFKKPKPTPTPPPTTKNKDVDKK
ncbi:TPA: hypothetical protein SMI12_001254 [Serratia liquefaciens]|nr:hypothetical protein [Serratia liquefaciens]